MTIINNAKELFDISQTISRKIGGEKENSLRIECMNNLGVYNTNIIVDNKFMRWVRGLTNGKMKLPISQVYNVRTTAFSPFPNIIKGNIKELGDEIIIDLKPLLKYEHFGIEFFFRMKDEFLGNIVRTRSSKEPLSTKIKYEISAQLKNPKGLKLGFSEIDIEEFPITTRVHVADRINLNVPDYVKKLVEIEADILEERDPRAGIKIINLQKERGRLLRKLGKKTIIQKFEEMSNMLTPTKFAEYIKFKEDIRFDRCEKGNEFFSTLGASQLPKFMNVISHGDLTLEKPALKGIMLYESKKFDVDLKKFF